MTASVSLHGGPDALGVPLYDFSTNSNACGPCPQAVAALQACDARHYPDPAYTVLRQQLAQRGGDYAQAASAWGLAVDHAGPAALQWHADPSSPLGQSVPQDNQGSFIDTQVLDCAYEPLRLSGASVWSAAQRDTLWQLWTPNKALGLTGVRAAYAIAPLQAQASVDAIHRLCASWPIGAHGVALLQSWMQPDVQSWLVQSRMTLRNWKQRQIGVLEGLGWTCLPSEVNFFGARPLGDAPAADLGVALAQLRSHGIKLRDATSFGLPGHVRVSVQPPVAQDALARAWTQWKEAV